MSLVPKDFKSKLSEVLYVSTFPPRECGIATFTRDLTEAMDKKFNPVLKSKILAMNDSESSFYNYDKRVRFQISDSNVEDYIDIAKEINKSDKIQLVNVQHEFGLFGGEYGDYLIPFLETLNKPVVTTFHTVLPNPDENRKRIVRAIAKRSSAIIVIINEAVKILREDYGIRNRKIRVIPHGIPSVSFGLNKEMKEELGLKGKVVLSTYGLLSRGKGIEHVIKAVASLVEKYPNLLYLVLGETHPQVRKHEGERYRNKLIKLAESLGLRENVKFYNKYLSYKELISYLCASDVYISASLDKNQISSGTIPYAMGCGKAVVSTPSLYAIENLSNERGVLINFRDPKSTSEAIDRILSDNNYRRMLEINAYEHTRRMIWPNVASTYLRVFNEVVKLRNEDVKKFPRIKLDHLIRLSDDFGILQHAEYATSRKETGYTLDDNTRALVVAIKYNRISKCSELIKKYLDFIKFVQKRNGSFHNYVSYDKEFLDEEGSEDSFGRALWALGYLIDSDVDELLRESADIMFLKAIWKIGKLESPRSKAFSIIGLYHYYQRFSKKEIVECIERLADSLIESFRKESTEDWKWFERYLTYSNGKLSESLFLAYEVTKNRTYLNVAKESLDFLSGIVFEGDRLDLIGHDGWYNYRGKRAFYDQQPVDAMSMVHVYLAAYRVSKDEEYYRKAVLSFNWFLGRNKLDQMLYDPSTGGCCDGLGRCSVNLNQGAESTISYLLARLSLEEMRS